MGPIMGHPKILKFANIKNYNRFLFPKVFRHLNKTLPCKTRKQISTYVTFRILVYLLLFMVAEGIQIVIIISSICHTNQTLILYPEIFWQKWVFRLLKLTSNSSWICDYRKARFTRAPSVFFWIRPNLFLLLGTNFFLPNFDQTKFCKLILIFNAAKRKKKN